MKKSIVFVGVILIVGIIIALIFVFMKKDNNLIFIDDVDGNIRLRQEKLKDAEISSHLKIYGTDIDYGVIEQLSYQMRENKSESDIYLFSRHYGGYMTKGNNVHFSYITGHNIRNLSATPKVVESTHERFEQLLSYDNFDFARNNQFFKYTTTEEMLFQIFAVGYVQAGITNINYNLTKEETKNMIDYFKSYSLYNYDIDVNNEDKLIILETCTRKFGTRSDIVFVVVGRMIRKNETIKNITVSVNENRIKIEDTPVYTGEE